MNMNNLVNKLLATGMKKAQIARHIGLNRAALTYASKNKEWNPSWLVGERLVRLAKENKVI